MLPCSLVYNTIVYITLHTLNSYIRVTVSVSTLDIQIYK